MNKELKQLLKQIVIDTQPVLKNYVNNSPEKDYSFLKKCIRGIENIDKLKQLLEELPDENSSFKFKQQKMF